MEFFLTDIEIDALIKEEKRIDQPISDFKGTLQTDGCADQNARLS